jgi:hypothetical protein
MDGLLCADQPDTCPGQVTHQNESEQWTRACLIPIPTHEHSAEPCKEGVDCLKTGGLLENGWGPLLDWPDTCPRQVTHQNKSEQCTRACLIPIRAREPSAEPCKEGMDFLKSGGLLRNGWSPLPDGPHTCARQVMRQNESEQCPRACLIPIRACKPSAEPCKEVVDCLKTGGLLQNGWTPLLDQSGTCPRRVMRQNRAEQCTRACLISIWGCKPSAEPCKQGVDCLKIGGLLRSLKWMDSFAGLAQHLPKASYVSK